MNQEAVLAELRQIQKELEEIKQLVGTKPHPLFAPWREPKRENPNQLTCPVSPPWV